MGKSIQQRFEEKVEYIPFSTCHYWVAATNEFGYGKLSVPNNKWVFAHRYAWEQKNGKVSDGLFVLHKCDNPACVNVNHLYVGDLKQNATDREDRNRGNHVCGTKNGRNVLMQSQVYEIRDAFDTGKYSFKELGRIYGIDGKSVADIVDRKIWNYLI